MTSSRCHLCHAGCTNSTAERIMKCTNRDCSSRKEGAAPIDRDDNAVLNIAHRVLAAWLDPEGKSSSALRRPELLKQQPSAAAVSAAAAARADVDAAETMVSRLAELDAEAEDCPDQVVDVLVAPVAAAAAAALAQH